MVPNETTVLPNLAQGQLCGVLLNSAKEQLDSTGQPVKTTNECILNVRTDAVHPVGKGPPGRTISVGTARETIHRAMQAEARGVHAVWTTKISVLFLTYQQLPVVQRIERAALFADLEIPVDKN
jgi:hypothetical protein